MSGSFVNKERALKAFKGMVIVCLLMAITVLVILNWKSDMIIEKVLNAAQEELTDSLRYTSASLDLFSHFPNTAIHIQDLHIGSGKHPLIRGGDIDVVLGLFSLLKGNILIHKLQVVNAAIHIENKDGRWSYDILKEKGESQDSVFNTQIRQLTIEHTTLHYNDGKDLRVIVDIANGMFKGGFEKEKLDLTIELTSVFTALSMDSYTLSEPFPAEFKGAYSFDMASGLQLLNDWTLENEALQLSAGGAILREKDHEMVDMEIAWSKVDMASMKKWFPEAMQSIWNQYRFTGELEGRAILKGKSSTKDSPRITASATMKKGSIAFVTSQEELKGLEINVSFDSGAKDYKTTSVIEVVFEKDALIGKSLTGQLVIRGLDRPVLDISLNGTLPAGLLNLANVEGLRFDKGTFDISDFTLSGFRTSTYTFADFIKDGKINLATDDLSLLLFNNQISIPKGKVSLSEGKLDIDLDQFTWKKAIIDDLKGSMVSGENQIAFNLEGILCEGHVETKGRISDMDKRPVAQASWKVTGIEMKKLLESFSNFDQTFLTSENLEGKANIWATSVLPFDEKWNLLTKSVNMKSGIEIKDGRLRGMKTLEDFSDYVHLSDLQDIRFNQLRNFMEIKNGIVYLPVMFIQSSALNLSISGEHSFDQDILYHLKLNAGQVAANKLKKNESRKDLKPARKSGWINMYFILSGTTSNVKYQQNRVGVIAGFEQTTLHKEGLRNYMVENFGYDLYWLEPNEWEDIPEYE